MTNNRLSCRNSTQTRNNIRNSAACKNLQLKLQQIDFAIADTVLYLDAYPECRKALAYYHQLLSKRNELKQAINENCGPICNTDNLSTDMWLWVESPWPWQAEAN